MPVTHCVCTRSQEYLHWKDTARTAKKIAILEKLAFWKDEILGKKEKKDKDEDKEGAKKKKQKEEV